MTNKELRDLRMKVPEDRDSRYVREYIETAARTIREQATTSIATKIAFAISKPHLVLRIIDGVKAVYPEIQATIENPIHDHSSTCIIFDWSS
jgi:hypothetical protein